MPQQKYLEAHGLSKWKGPSLIMKASDHRKTRTYGRRGSIIFNKEKDLSPREVLARDLWDIKKQFGRKYNKGMKELLEYAKTLPEYKK